MKYEWSEYEYPDGISMEEVDYAVTTVCNACEAEFGDRYAWTDFSLRAIAGIVLKSQKP